jgi:hypothetical protein
MSRYESRLVTVNYLLLSAVFLAFLLVINKSGSYVMAMIDKPVDNKLVLSSTVYTSYYLPFGGRQLMPSYRLVALYGTPDYPTLGVLGEQSISESIKRAQALTVHYQPYSDETIIPALDLISTIAAADATDDGNYSREIKPNKLKPWVDAAKRAGVYIVLDLQPGRTSFLTQAKQYESLLLEPHVGLALDPEWRLESNQFHLRQIGSVKNSEINATSLWLAELVKANNLPQKLFMVHQFKLSMIENSTKIDTTRPELAYVIQMDGQGPQPTKDDTYSAITRQPAKNMHFGWKNFYDEDKPSVRTPAQTMQMTPKPWYVSYQ